MASSLPPVTPERVDAASRYIANTRPLSIACRQADVTFHLACALIEKESGGRNVYGHDRGGVYSTTPQPPVTALTFAAFLVAVMNGAISNGVGPCQITYAGGTVNGHRDGGYFRQMLEEGLAPWSTFDNMLFGLRILGRNLTVAGGDIAAAGAAYNGGSNPSPAAIAYGKDLAAKDAIWRTRLGIVGG